MTTKKKVSNDKSNDIYWLADDIIPTWIELLYTNILFSNWFQPDLNIEDTRF